MHLVLFDWICLKIFTKTTGILIFYVPGNEKYMYLKLVI